MLIGKKYKVVSDNMQCTLLKSRNNKKGGVVWGTIGYYADPKSALKALVDAGVRDTGMDDLQTVVNKIAELKKLINGLEIPPEATRPA